jgi:hypothetical protein
MRQEYGAGQVADRWSDAMEHLRAMKMDWKALVSVTGDHLIGTTGSVLSAVLVALGLSILLLIVYWKLGVFKRPTNKWYNIGVKLYIPYLLVVCITIGAQFGFYRGVYRAVVAVNDAVVGELYHRAIGPVMGTEESRRAFLAAVQEKARGSVSMGQAITSSIKEVLHTRLDADASLSNRAVAGVADWFIDRYENDIATAVLYGLYLKTGDYLHVHSAGKPLEYHEFKEGTDHLLQLDLTKVETAIQGNLGALTHGLLERQYNGMVKGLMLMGAMLTLLPLVEWGIYWWVMRSRMKQAPPGPPVVVPFEPPVEQGAVQSAK